MWTFDEPNPIKAFVVGLELASQLPPLVAQSVSRLHPQFKRELPRKLDQPILTLPMPGMAGVPQAQIGGVAFDSVKPDGAIARALTVGPIQINYMVADYPRWIEFKPQANRHIRAVTSVVINDVAIRGVMLEATNQFIWRGDTNLAPISEILNNDTKFVTKNMLSLNDHCHSFHGYVERNFFRDFLCVHNINIQTGDTPEGLRVINIVLNHRATFATPIVAMDDIFSGDDTGLFPEVCEKMHSLNNALFSDVVNPNVVSRIPGLEKSC